MKKRTIISGHILATTMGCLIALAMASCYLNRAEAANSSAESPDWIRAHPVNDNPGIKTPEAVVAPFVVQQEVLDPPPALRFEIRLFIDQRTGCHWLVTGAYGQPATLTPRLYSDGVQVCD